MNENIALIQNKIIDPIAAIGFQASDERNPIRVAMFLHAIHAHGKNPEEKLSLLSTSFTDLTLRKIGTQSSEFAQELREEFSSSRKSSRRALPSITALQKAQELKRNLASIIQNSPLTQPIHFATPRRQQSSSFSEETLRTDTCLGLVPPRNLSRDFEHTVLETPTKEQRDLLVARLTHEALVCDVSETELLEAEEILRKERSHVSSTTQTFSVRSENEALERLFRMACVLILKHSAHEDITRFYKRGTTQFDWEYPTDDRLSLDRLTEQFRNSSYSSLPPNASAQTACVKFVTDLAKFEWLLSLYNKPEVVETSVKTFKNLLGSRIESLLQPHEMFLKSNALDNHDVRIGKTTSFDFYKHRLNVISKHDSSKSVNFLSDRMNPPPQHYPSQGIIKTLNSKESRPISGDPAGQCYHEQRTDKVERTSETVSKYRMRPSTPGADKRHKRSREERDDHDRSASEIDESDHDPTSGDESDARRRSRSTSRGRDKYDSNHRRPASSSHTDEPRRSSRLARFISDPVVRFIEKTIAKAIDKNATKRPYPRDASRSPGRPPPFTQHQPRRIRDCRPPPDACPALARGTPCGDSSCIMNHGIFYMTTPDGQPTKPCEFEAKGQPCPYLWMPSGCYFAHSVANPKNGRAAIRAAPTY